jgi:PAS domain S-box-containing protein
MGRGLRLLVVEDSDDDFQLLRLTLMRGEYDVTSECVCDEPALDRALRERWDIVVTDWMLPGFGGRQVLDMLSARAPGTPCIVISGTPNEEAAVEALRAGALDFLAKDKPRRFVPAIERALRESEERRALRAVETELRLSEERFRANFEAAPEPICTYDLEARRIVDVNAAWVKLFGYSKTEARTLDLGQLSADKLGDGRSSADAAAGHLARVWRGDVAVTDWTSRDSRGTEFPTEMHLSLLPSSGRKLLRISVVDLRERYRIEEIRRRAIELELQNRRIQEANRLKSEFLANMSHELRTPLNAIIGFAELLHDGAVDPGTPQHQEFLGDILTSGRHLLRLINDVLDLAKVEAGRLDFRPEPSSLRKMLDEVVSITRTTAAAKKIAVTVEVAPEIDAVVLDPSRFKQVAYNYVSNALKFTPDAGRVQIRAFAQGATTFQLEVEDNGPGISTADLGRLFVEFQQLDGGSSKRHAGTGLGLALTKRLVEAQGGQVGVRSAVGQGSVFYATLPRTTKPADVAISSHPARSGAASTRTVLVVEDEPLDRDVIVDALTNAGYAVETAVSASAALARCRERSFDAVTLDLLLPDMSGFDLLAALRAEPAMRTVPVIVVTVVPDMKRVAGFAVHDVLRKPLDPGALLACLERAGVAPEKAGGVLVVDDDDGALKLMHAMLGQLGFSAITRTNGRDALVAAEQLSPSAVVLDLMMPGMDGLEFLDRFRRLPAHARTPVVIWTMKDLTASEHEQLRASAQGVVSKNGGSPSNVVAQLRTLLGGS